MNTIVRPTKERSDMILDPMQVMVQLSLLSFSPVGTKIRISNNILRLQMPSFYQGLQRWYSGDTRDELYYLFSAMRRYHRWYCSKNHEVFPYILTLAQRGLDQLIKTYRAGGKPHLIHTLELYKNVLTFPAICQGSDMNYGGSEETFVGIVELYQPKTLTAIFNILQLLEEEDNIEDKESYIRGLQSILHPVDKQIRTWFTTKLVY